MKKFDLTTRINIKIVCIVSVFMLIIIGHSQWVSFKESKAEYAERLVIITDFIAIKMPPASFIQIAERQGAAGKSMDEQVMAINREIQPILENMLIPEKAINYGVYSLRHQRTVAVGPVFDASLLTAMDPAVFGHLYQTNTPRFLEKKNSIIWYGAPVIIYQRPITFQGQVIGHAFAAVNLNFVEAQFWKRLTSTFLGGLIALMAVVMLFQESFTRLKRDLDLFAEAIVKGRAKHFESKIPELNPVLQYISEQTEQMARLDRLNVIGEMAASIGHEVRNPMTTVRGFLQYLGGKDEYKKSREHLVLMIEELDCANSIITEFLSLAKNKAMHFREINLNGVINEVAPLIQADAIRFNCQIKTELGQIKPIRADEGSIRQLILNMVRNGIEAMPNGGTVLISTEGKDGKVLLSIQDHGAGIPDSIVDKLGTPFVTTKENGVGLGLAVCYRIAQRHGAAIYLKTELGKGTVFTIGFFASDEVTESRPGDAV